MSDFETVGKMLMFFMENCEKLCKKHVPRKRKLSQKNKIPRDQRTLMRSRTKLLKKLSKKPTPNTDSGRESVENKVKEIETKLKESYEKEREHKENKALMAIKTNPKYFHSYAQKKLKSRAKIGPLED